MRSPRVRPVGVSLTLTLILLRRSCDLPFGMKSMPTCRRVDGIFNCAIR